MKEFLIVMLAIGPMIIFLDWALDIRLVEDFGSWKALGFIACMVFYSEVMNKHKPEGLM